MSNVSLLTPELRAAMPPLYSQEKSKDPIVHCKFFIGSWTWYATEGEEQDDDFIFFGLVQGHEVEWGYFLLSDLESAHGPLGLPIERDLYFKPTPISEVLK